MSGPGATAPVSSFQSLETDWGILFYNKTATNLSAASKICQSLTKNLTIFDQKCNKNHQLSEVQ